VSFRQKFYGDRPSGTPMLDIIRTAYYIHGLELMKLIFAVLDVSLTMGLTRCYKTEGFFTFIYSNTVTCLVTNLWRYLCLYSSL